MRQIGQYQIDIYRDSTYRPNSVDNLHKYDFEYLKETVYSFSSIFGIKVFENDELIKAAVIGSDSGATGIYENSVIYETNRIVICCSDIVYCLAIPDLTLLWQTKADRATCFAVYKHKTDYIVHGELEISMLDKNGNIVWRQLGCDIFVTPNQTSELELTDNYVIVTDWDNKIYKFGYDGNDYTNMRQFHKKMRLKNITSHIKILYQKTFDKVSKLCQR